jgi:dihydroxyacetone kinase-like protein
MLDKMLDLIRASVEVNARTRSIGVALTSCTVPAAGSPTRAILADSDAPPSGSVLLVVNGFGGTPALELYLM